MPRIPDTPIGLIIRESGFAAISVGADEVMVALSGLRGAFERVQAAPATPAGVSAVLPGCIREIDQLIDVIAERIAVLRGISTTDAKSTLDSSATGASGVTTDDDEAAVDDSLRRLSSIERQLRNAISKTRRDPPTQLLYINALAAVERQQWQLEQAVGA